MNKRLSYIVQVYWNSHKKLFSVRHNGKVIGWEANFALNKAKFVVSEKGRQRVLAKKKKAVHAWVEGSVDPADSINYRKPNIFTVKSTVTYNPFKHESFVDTYSLAQKHVADLVLFEVINNKPILITYDFYEQNPIVVPIEFCRKCTA